LGEYLVGIFHEIEDQKFTKIWTTVSHKSRY